MRLTTLGTGTVALSAERVCSGALVEAGEVRLLLDCGPGIAHRLSQHVPSWRTITHLALSHFHHDHIGDVPTLVMAWKYGDLPGRTQPLTVIGPAGTADLLAKLADAHGNWMREPGFPVTVVELAPGAAYDLGDGARITAATVPHTDESLSYAIARGSARLVYTGDTGYDAMLGEWARGASVLLAECSLPPDLAIPEHLTPAQCGALAAAALPKHLVLTHLYPPVERTDVRGTIAAHYAGPVTIAHDGAAFEIEED